ncbi:MAG: PEGA domain-containing protein [Vicinamibacterales bacterium]
MSRQTWVMLGIIAVIGVVGVAVWNFDLERPAPVVARAPAKPLPEPVRDTSAPAVAARGIPKVSTGRVSSPGAPRQEPSPEPTVLIPTTATLRINTDVPGALVFVDRKFIGEAPVTAEEIAPGSHQINVSAKGYDGVVETLDVTAGPRDVLISLKTIRLDQSIAVTHKHAMGSCAGRLVATPEGLRYETDNKNDEFSSPLTGLETFKVDFIAKNLKVKVKGGRTYDFTDPDGKADPLYLFHEAVEKARLRQVTR